MKAALITTGSVLMTTSVIGNAFYQKKQFYPSVVYLTKSNPSMAVIYIQSLVMILLLGKLFRKIFFGNLRAAELEHLIERCWYALTETCLAFTVFRDDLSARFIGLFALLLFLKCFHWLAEDRIDFMERSPNISVLFHIRILSLLSLLSTCDCTFIYIAYNSTLTRGAGVHLVFGFEYAILFVVTLNILMKYILHWIDLTSDNPWEEKAVCLLYTELVMGIMKVVLYLVFITVMIKFHNFPLFAIRPMYLSMRTLKKAFCDVIMSRRAIRNMNTLYPNATPEELANSDNICIICREEMTGNGTSKKLPCNHIFHVACLRSWFQRQQTCPTCRMDVLRTPVEHVHQQGLQAPPRGGRANLPQQNIPTDRPSTGSTNPPNNQNPIIMYDQMPVIMMQTFAQMFVQAMVTHLNVQNMLQTAHERLAQQHRQQQCASDTNTTNPPSARATSPGSGSSRSHPQPATGNPSWTSATPDEASSAVMQAFAQYLLQPGTSQGATTSQAASTSNINAQQPSVGASIPTPAGDPSSANVMQAFAQFLLQLNSQPGFHARMTALQPPVSTPDTTNTATTTTSNSSSATSQVSNTNTSTTTDVNSNRPVSIQQSPADQSSAQSTNT